MKLTVCYAIYDVVLCNNTKPVYGIGQRTNNIIIL